MYLLFEVGILAARLLVPGYKEVEAQRRQLASAGKKSQNP
jgi:hypothetical protein